jgi:hypothetical protein
MTPMSQRQVYAGAGFTLTAHVATLAIPLALALWLAAPDNAYDEDRTWFFLYGGLIGQVLLLVLAVIVGATLASYRPHRPAVVGVFVGWAIGVLIMPILCVILWRSVIHPGGRVDWILGLATHLSNAVA